MKLRAFILFFLCFNFSSTVQAISQDESENYLNVKKSYFESDRALNEIYRYQINKYKEEGGSFYGQKEFRDIPLKQSQQVWIKMRDASCNYETYESRTGTGFSTIYAKCLLDKTNERIKYLKDNE
ncbi:lysozyme inhibitor LprI family protein [Yokenella regensburgei]|uniref:lysozyme inhibitor LprI family protein n=1 Tax=Yokenella regensburgei TaxID=158877 RepID=UPI0035B1481C